MYAIRSYYGEEKTIHLSFDDKTFRYWNQKTGKWEVEGGCYQISVGANVRDIRLFGEISKDSTTDQYPYDPQGMPAYYSGMIQKVQNKEFEALLGKPIPDGKWSGKLEINDAICQMYYAKSGLARLIYNILTSVITSYSIHYTKLYETILLPAQRLCRVILTLIRRRHSERGGACLCSTIIFMPTWTKTSIRDIHS